MGVDVEQARPGLDRALTRLRARHGSLSDVQSLTADWTRREALAKVFGDDLSRVLRLVLPTAVGTDGDIVVSAHTAVLLSPCRIRDLQDPSPGYHGSIALAGSEPFRVRSRRWPGLSP